jgi:hypothetical protein
MCLSLLSILRINKEAETANWHSTRRSISLMLKFAKALDFYRFRYANLGRGNSHLDCEYWHTKTRERYFNSEDQSKASLEVIFGAT